MSIAAGVLAAVLAILLLLRLNEGVAEWMAANVSRGWISIMSRITGIFSFSLYETMLYVMIIAAIALITTAIVFFCKKAAMRACTYLMIILLVALSFGDVYTLSAGFAYFREDVDLPFYDREYISESQKEEIFELAEFMVDDFNYLSGKMARNDGMTISPYTNSELSKKLTDEYKRLDSDYFSDFTPRAKSIMSKNIMSHMHITGVFFAPFGEANVNPLTPASDMPVTMAHELAHSKGVMREDEANLVAYWLLITSEDEYLRYSGYCGCYYRLFPILAYFDSKRSSELYAKIDGAVFTEERLASEFWASYTLFDGITEAFNDLYLKLQGQKEGTGSYFEPNLEPGEIEVPGETEGEPPHVETAFLLNNVQRMMIKAIEERKSA